MTYRPDETIELRKKDIVGCTKCGRRIALGDIYYEYNPEDRGSTRLIICDKCRDNLIQKNRKLLKEWQKKEGLIND